MWEGRASAHSEYSTVIAWREKRKFSHAFVMTSGFTIFFIIFDMQRAYHRLRPLGASRMSL